MSWPPPSERVAVLLRAGAERILDAATEEMFARVDAASLAEHDAAVAEDPALLATFRRANRATIVHWAEAVLRDPGAPVPAHTGPEALTLARDLVRRGLDGRALEPYRAGQNAAWQAWMEIAFGLTADAALLHELLAVSARSIFAYVDATMAATYERIARERADLTRGTSAERLEMATLVLEGAPVEPGRASRRLAYDLEGAHVAAIAWSEGPGVPSGGLEQAAQALADAVGAARPLAVAA
ncbi:PucR family transcriptional regulator, partial [Patulibacter sp. S7RM1-6]